MHLPCSPTPARLSPLYHYGYYAVVPIDKNMKTIARALFSRLYHMAFAFPVYASCLHFYRRRNTRFWMLVRLSQVGLVTYRFLLKSFKELLSVPFSRALLGAICSIMSKFEACPFWKQSIRQLPDRLFPKGASLELGHYRTNCAKQSP